MTIYAQRIAFFCAVYACALATPQRGGNVNDLALSAENLQNTLVCV